MSSEDMAARLVRLEERVDKLERRLEVDGAVEAAKSKKLSPKEFLLSKNPKSETQKVVAIAYFLERQEALSSFNVSDLEGAFRAAREKLPKNMNDAVNKNIARGFLMPAAEKKDFKEGVATYIDRRAIC